MSMLRWCVYCQGSKGQGYIAHKYNSNLRTAGLWSERHTERKAG